MIDRCYIEITNICNLNCHFCPKHERQNRSMTVDEFELITDKLQGRITFLYFHLMGEPLLHPHLPQFIETARRKGFHTVLTSNGTLLDRATSLLDTLPHKIQLSLHSHESNGRDNLALYINKVLDFSIAAADKGTCIVLRLWNSGGRDTENETIISLLRNRIPTEWKERPDGYRLCDNIYLEYDRKFEWPTTEERGKEGVGVEEEQEKVKEEGEEEKVKEEKALRSATDYPSKATFKEGYFCKALLKQIGILADGTLVPCCLDHNGDVPLGNIFRQSLDEILTSPRAQAIIEGFKHHKATEPLCRNCESALITNSFRGKKKRG